MSRHPQITAIDIETCPQPEASFSEAQQRRFDKRLRRRRGKSIDESLDETKAAVRALSPYLGWICCISLCRYVEGADAPRAPFSYSCPNRMAEEKMLRNFWSDVGALRGNVIWVSFNGKRFDSPYLRLRSLACGVEPTLEGLLNTHKWRDEPHTDLWRYADGGSLADYCDLLDVASPKGEMDGSDVWPAIQDGRLGDVAHYCEKDALATMRSYLESRHTFA